MSGLVEQPRPNVGSYDWLVAASEEELAGFEIKDWSWLRSGPIAAVEGAGIDRKTLASPAHEDWFSLMVPGRRLAVVNVVLDDSAAVAHLLGFVVEPALRLGVDLVISADRDLADLSDSEFFEPWYGYAYSLQRLRWQLEHRRLSSGPPATLPDTDFKPDEAQRRAVEAGTGVVQVIAPAGSGKTAVLVERVRELRRRGVPADRILCLAFGKGAKEELVKRLVKEGVGAVRALTFAGLAWWICEEAKRFPENSDPLGPNLAQWRRLAFLAHDTLEKKGDYLEPDIAQQRMTDVMLTRTMEPDEFAELAARSADPIDTMTAELYKQYTLFQRKRDRVSHEQLMVRAIKLMRHDSDVRLHWQRYEHVLVDEYQDIEPAQELLVRTVAAPHDQLFCVGDEDQTIYAWRRADVTRVIAFDKDYPGLERPSLDVNYRCPPVIARGSARLIANNSKRFANKLIEPNPMREPDGGIRLSSAETAVQAALEIADLLRGETRDSIAVLARTNDALRPIALACADLAPSLEETGDESDPEAAAAEAPEPTAEAPEPPVKIDGSDKLFQPTGARQALIEHLRLAAAPEAATAELVRAVCARPGRGLKREAEAGIAERLRDGASFKAAFADVGPTWRRGKTFIGPGKLFELLAPLDDAGEAVALLREEGGLDDWFEQHDDIGGMEQYECDVLAQAQRDAAGTTPPEYLSQLQRQAIGLSRIRDKVHGIQLLTIHRSKGQQWPHVILASFDDRLLPHPRAMNPDYAELQRGEGPEAERRLAYVAFTRAIEHLDVYFEEPSRYLEEAGFIDPPHRRRARGQAIPVRKVGGDG